MEKILIKEIINLLIKECKKDDTLLTIEDKILGPLIDYILIKIKPYILATSIFFILLIIMIISIIILIIMY